MHRHTILIGGLLLGATAVPLATAEPVDLRGYGKVAAELTPTRAVFACESVEKADLLLDKLQADLFWDKALPATTSEAKPAALRIWSIPGYGSALIARSGMQVVVLGGADAAEVARKAGAEALLKDKDATSTAAKPHPRFLDYFDHKAYSAYASSFIKTRGSDGRRFMKQLGAGNNYQGPVFEFECPAPGVGNWPQCDAELREAERQQDLVVLGLSGGGNVPLWVRNARPGNLMRSPGTTVMGDWGGACQAGIASESWMTPFDQRLQSGLGYQRTIMERYRASPALGAWFIADGSPGGEYALGHGRAMRSWDASPTGTAGWRRWLRDECHWSLADLGQRWHGDPKYFASWDAVAVPDRNTFFGELGPDSFRIADGWRWKNQEAFPGEALDPAAEDWVPVPMPPAQRVAFLDAAGVNVYEATLDPGTWLAKQPAGAETWLVVALNGCGGNATRIWLNGEPLELPRDPASQDESFAIKVSGQLKPGGNRLQIALNCALPWLTRRGQLAGPVFLTTREPRRFPYLGRQANARFLDLVNWQAWALSDYHRQAITLARKLDPDRPFILSGGLNELFDHMTRMCADFGMGNEITWRECSYSPWFAGSGLAAGFYGTGEESWIAKGTDLDRSFGWSLFDADGAHTLYPSVEHYEAREQEDGWFTRHKRQINLFGKYLREQPKVALLFSGQNHRLTSVGWTDIGVDALPASHFDNVYVSESGLKTGLADPYPILVDSGNPFMDAELGASIGQYAERGGSFIALGTTGRHAGIEADAFPIAKLGGYKPGEARRGRIRFEAQLPVFTGWEQREFDTDGVALVASVPDDKSAIPLARWSDGSVAIACRKLGKGRVITLGCSLWRFGRDLSGAWKTQAEVQDGFFQRLFADCGAVRDAEATRPDVWTRKMVTKNGLQHWLLAFNATVEPREADVRMAVEGKPDQVIDLDTNASVPFTLENGGIRINAVAFDPYAVRIFAVRRATLVGGLPQWWYEKTRYWKRTPAQIEAAQMALPAAGPLRDESVIPISRWRFATDPDQAIAKQGQWLSPPFDATAWANAGVGPWNLTDPKLADYQGTGLYRATFTVPPAWKGRRILLNLYNFDDPIVYDSGEFFVNGVQVASYKAHYWSQTCNYDVSAQVHPGENVLALQVKGGAKNGGLGGSVWIEAPPPLSQVQDLSGTWQGVAGDWLTRFEVQIPNPGDRAKYLTREFQVPAAWAGKEVFLEWSAKEQRIASVLINGQPINANSYAHPFGTIARVNLGSSIKAGESNVIELWPHMVMTSGAGNGRWKDDILQLDTIRIGCR